ncbi:Hpt domain-containing protein [Halopseudomonas xiamenensis]|uniref:Hpt domain-containing protein n=1 Tax=Halopseudomonas xiamenensis TaxID=157792 RepID=UPI001626C8C6|nr:Hpt domain-containing protein [Halopseudomonas xiamenensis]
MGDRHDYVALDWVKGEISETLNQARQALKAFVDNPGDTTRLRFCLTYIHQVHGTLQMVEFYGAALLAEEMEKLAQALMHGSCSRESEALEVLMQAILQMPAYLDRVQRGRRDLPLLLLPLLNDMRTARGEKLLSENALFNPELKAGQEAAAERQVDFSSEQVVLQLRKLRQAMQIAHAAIIREQDVQRSSQQLGRVFVRLEQLFQGTRFAELWAIFAGVAEGLEYGSIDNGAAIRQLLRQADRELRQLLDEPALVSQRAPAPELLRNLLFYVAKSGGNSPRLDALQQHYQLQALWVDAEPQAQPSDSPLVGPDRGTMQSVALALNEELLQVKERLDLFVRSNERRTEELDALLPNMKRIADTLAVLGLGQPRRVLQEQIERVEQLASASTAPSDAQLMEVAGGMLYVEASMHGIFAMERATTESTAEGSPVRQLASAQEMLQIQQQVVFEARNALEQTREAINAFIAGQWDYSQLEPVDELLNSVRGGLAMLPLERAAAAVAACRLYLSRQLLRERQVPDWEALDALADVITSIDYYLERVAEDNADRGDSILAVAEQRLALLGYAPADLEALQSEEPEQERAAPAPAPATPVSTADEGDDDEVDPELLEIFIEEVGEVLETLDEYTPRWQADLEDGASRAEVRRGFHTLKGSGRMVKAGVLAELAWAVENMLNRVIDGNVAASPPVFAVVNAVRALMPALLEGFAAGRQQVLPEVERLASQAEALARGELPETLPSVTVEEQPAEPQQAVDSIEQPDMAELELADSVDNVGDSIDLDDIPLPEMEPFAGLELPEDEAAQVQLEDLSASEPELPMDIPPASELPTLPELEELPAADLVEDTDSEPDAIDAPLADYPPPAMEPAEQPEQAAAEQQLEAEPEAPPTITASAQTELDPLLLKIFRAETQTHIEQISAFLDKCEQGLPCPLSDALQRALHTLKGSAHMAGIQPIARLATPLEKLTKDFKANLIPADHALVELLGDALGMLRGWQEQDDANRPIDGTEAFLQRLETIHRDALEKRDSSRSQLEGASDTDLLSIFLTEGIDLLLDAADELLQEPATVEHAAVARALRALAEVAVEVELGPIDELCQGLEDVHEALLGKRLPFSDEVAACLAQGHERLIGMMDQVAAHQHIQPATAELQALQALFTRPIEQPEPSPTPLAAPIADVAQGIWNPGDAGTDAELVDIFLEEAQEILDTSAASLQQWLADTDDDAPLHALLRDLHTLKGGARMAEIRPVGDLAHELEFLYEGLAAHRFDILQGLPELLQACQDGLAEMVEGIIGGRSISDGMALIRAIRDFRAEPDRPPRLPSEAPVEPPAAAPVETPLLTLAAPVSGMLGMFLEEAGELLQPCAELLARREAEPQAAQELLHRIQTLKGSARLADQQALAEQARRLETALQQTSPSASNGLDALLDELQTGVEQLAAGQDFPAVEWTLPVTPGPLVEAPAAAAGADTQQTLAEVRAILQQAMAGDRPVEATNSRASVQETIKVPAPLLEELVNLAGETSIFRGRVEQQVSDISQTLTDMESTIERVRDQLRRLDMETQAQILSRHQEEIEQAYEDFDPLEMDRYSQLQQLSRSLFESASDMFDLKETLAAKSRDAETLLLQQARVNTELQEGLMRTRMVPFERLLPRLRRVVRQVSAELGKQVTLAVGNAEGEMDRSVLERMMGPLEHMLRNAVDHGIEVPALRAEQGKPESGRISLELHREGSEIIIRLADDGSGVDLDAVRSKAIERGLMDADAQLSDQEVLQFILEAGFSTAQRVTQISGRGVGMDVVNAEIKQLGGSMTLSTEPGAGTTFIIRLPFTVSVNRALMVYSGDDLYAIPLNTIEGIVRVSGYELEAYYAPDAPPFEYAGKQYDLRYIGDLLVTGQQPRLSGHSLPLPVILVRGAEHSVAVQVDSLAGSREIVVKSLGRQFAVVPGISGATILGDGRVVVILDLLAVIRAQQALHSQQQLAAERAAPQSRRSTLVMVVDDSITVRKVTSRLLERHGMEVITAKDGVEAIARLQDLQPDIMLLDIEMPRMDGFEVATLVRHDERLKDLPIIMITSRTGEKHRERARSLGVNEYLGKPYQEAQLLELIGSLVNRRD